MSSKFLVFVDDEPVYGTLAFQALRNLGGLEEFRFESAQRPRQLAGIPLAAVTHAVVDLSFGMRDVFADQMQEEDEMGVDAIATLLGVDGFQAGEATDCEVVVLTRLDQKLMIEMARAIRQTWPSVRFIDKADGRWIERVAAFARGATLRDGYDIHILLAGLSKVEPDEIVQAIARSRLPGRGLPVLTTLASFNETPTRAELARASKSSVRATTEVLGEAGAALVSAGILAEGTQRGVAELWPWARARRPILRAIEL